HLRAASTAALRSAIWPLMALASMTSPTSEIVISTSTGPVAFIFLAVGGYSGLTSVITRLCNSLAGTCSKSCVEEVEGGGGGGGGGECSSNRPRSSVPGGTLAYIGLR